MKKRFTPTYTTYFTTEELAKHIDKIEVLSKQEGQVLHRVTFRCFDEETVNKIFAEEIAEEQEGMFMK